MMRPSRTTRAHRAQTAVKVSLFPFLAVLICTMGALILLLVVLARQARLQADQTAQVEVQRHQEDLQAELEMVQWRIEQLRASRAKTEEQLQQIRLLLGHLEDHARRLRRRLAELQRTLAQLKELGEAGRRKRDELKAEYEAIQAAVEAAEKQLEESRKQLAEKQPAYAIIPYEGPYGTRRRPIYIECREDAVILQPEGVVLVPEDFEGPQGPGNPLAAALRAAREYLVTHGGFDPEKDGEPYPLLLVRPDGIVAYYAAREAMKSWGTEFGYELVGADWELLFPQPDAEMAEVMQAAVEKARARQRQLAAAAPRSYGSQSRRYFRVSPTGGGVIPDQPERSVSEESHEPAQVELPYDRVLAGAEPEASRTAGSPNSAQRSVGSMGGGLPGGGAQAGSGMLPPSGAAPGGTGGVAGQQAESFGATGNSHLLAGPSRAAGEANSSWGSGLGGAGGGVGSAGSARFGPGSGSHDASGQLQGRSGSSAAASGRGASLDSGVGRHGSGPSGPTEAVQTPGGHGAGPGGGTSSGPGSRAPAQQTIGGAGMQNAQDARHLSASGPHAAGSPNAGPAGPLAQAGGSAASGAGRGPSAGAVPGAQIRIGAGAGPFGAGGPQAPVGSPFDPPASLAETRGRDWALPQASSGAIAVVRPIRVYCYSDRMVLVPEPGLGTSKVVRFSRRPEAAIDELVSAVWVYVQSWGMAGEGMYWRPVLSVQVAPGAESRFKQIESLLEGSGLQIERK